MRRQDLPKVLLFLAIPVVTMSACDSDENEFVVKDGDQVIEEVNQLIREMDALQTAFDMEKVLFAPEMREDRQQQLDAMLLEIKRLEGISGLD